MASGPEPLSSDDLPTPIDVDQTVGPPIFIVGFGRSGTTLMRLMLSAHPRVYICHELLFYAIEAMADPSLSGEEFLPRFLDSFEWLGIDASRIKARVPPNLARRRVGFVFREIMREKSAAYGKVRYGDKSPYHSLYLARIYRDFPDARVILMVRDPRNNVASVSRMPFGSPRDEVNCLMYEFVRHQVDPFSGRLLRVRLEDLVADPRREMTRVLDFVGEQWDEAVLDHRHHIVDQGQMPPISIFESATEEPSAARAAPEVVNEERRRLIEVLCRKSMVAYGYPLSKPVTFPELVRTGIRVAGALPEIWRYLRAIRTVYRGFRYPRTWTEFLKQYRRVNPRWWETHPADTQRFEDWLRLASHRGAEASQPASVIQHPSDPGP